jgi:hypothetical protein
LLLKELINLTITQSKIPSVHKTAKLKMIPKKNAGSKNPNDYRPISLTSCIGKLIEKIISARLYEFVDSKLDKKLLIKQQSGFRKGRGAHDNLVYLTQKVSETFCRGKKVCAVFFDITKAFDSVWHKGLLYKLIKLGTPSYIVNRVEDFLKKRNFFVDVNNSQSDLYEILAGVPQGAAISPLLFSVFINDVPVQDDTNESGSLLFADDLVTFFIFDKPQIAQSSLRKYLIRFEEWLNQWRLRAAAEKCNFIIFTSNGQCREENVLTPKLYKVAIPKVNSTKFLGITFDRCLTFTEHLNDVKKKVSQRLNIIKILSNSSWHIDTKTLKNLYQSLVRSVVEYSFFIVEHLSVDNLKRLEAIQNIAFRCIYKLKYDTPVPTVLKIANETSLSSRLNELAENFIIKCLSEKNPLIVPLVREYKAFAPGRETDRKTFLYKFNGTLL